MEKQELVNQVDRAAARLGEVQRAVSEVIVGQDRLVESLLAALAENRLRGVALDVYTGEFSGPPDAAL